MYFPKIMVSCPFSYRKDYCLDDYFAHVLKLYYPEKQFYFVDNSPNPSYVQSKIEKWGLSMDWYDPKNMRNQDYHRDSMNIIREKFLKSDCDFLFILECDLFPPLDIIEQLLMFDTQIISVPYFLDFGHKSCLPDTEIEDGFGQLTTNRHKDWKEGFMDFKGDITEASQCGIGCVLIDRSVMEQTDFFTLHSDMSHCDMWFYFALKDLGIKVYYDTTQIIEHRNSEWKYVTDFKLS